MVRSGANSNTNTRRPLVQHHGKDGRSGEIGMLHQAAEENTRQVIQDVDARNTTLLFNNRTHSRQLITNSYSRQKNIRQG
jgi:hypothetical protein